ARGRGPDGCATASAGPSPGCVSRPPRRSKLSYRGKLVSALAVCVLSLTGAFALWACGAFFPNWLLWDESGGVLAAPTTWLREAVQPLLPPARPAFAAAVDPRGPL